MSNSTLNATHSPPQNFSSSPNLPDFSELAAKLQDTAQALLAFCRATPNAESAVEDSAIVKNSAAESTKAKKRPDETRVYRLPGFIVDEERRMLEAYKAEDWQEMLHIMHCQFQAVATLMRHFDEEEDVNGFFLNQIAESLLLPALDMLNRLCSLVADFRLLPQPEPGTE